MILQEVLKLNEMAKPSKTCEKCHRTMAAGHYWYKGGWKCKGGGSDTKKAETPAKKVDIPAKKPDADASPKQQWSHVFRDELKAGKKVRGINEGDELAALYAKRNAAKKEFKQLQARAGSGFQSGVAPEYRNQINRLTAAISELDREIQHIEKRGPAQRPTDWVGVANAKVADHEHVERRPDAGEHIGDGLRNFAELRAHFGGDPGLAREIRRVALQQVEQHGLPVSPARLAQHFDTTPRRMYDWLATRPELADVRKMLPRGGNR